MARPSEPSSRARVKPAAGPEPETRADVFVAAGRALDEAAEHGLVTESCLELAGLRLRLRVAGPRVAPLIDAAFGHLRVPCSDEVPDDLVLIVVDGALSAARALGDCPPLAPGDDRHRAADFGDGALVVFDLENRRALQWIPDVAKIPSWAAASPLRTVLATFLRAHGRYLLHGAAIGDASGGVLIAARGGSGKSTAALACLDAHGRAGAPRLLVAGDDFVVLEPDPEAPRVHSLLATAKLERAHAQRFPGLARFITGDGGPLDSPSEKAVLRLYPDAAERLARVLTLRAIAVPVLDLDRAECRVTPIPRPHALRALAPSSIYLVPGAGAETFHATAKLVAALPTYQLTIGHDASAIPEAIAALLKDTQADRAAEAKRRPA